VYHRTLRMIDLPPPLPPAAALETLAQARCGFCFVDVGLSLEDINAFEAIVVERSKELNQFGDLRALEEAVFVFLGEVGPNPPDLARFVAVKVARVAAEILALSDKPSFWISLRASTPRHEYDIPRWHFDGYYMPTLAGQKAPMQYKFALTLKGPSTLFCPIPTDFAELRQLLSSLMTNRPLMSELCGLSPLISPPKGFGAFFIGGNPKTAAVHSEPRLAETTRLFLSIVPCNLAEVERVKAKLSAS